VIISGIWYTGANSISIKDFGPGSVITMPADWVHVSGVAAEACAYYTNKAKESSTSTRCIACFWQIAAGFRI
jgi:hypothetical protein